MVVKSHGIGLFSLVGAARDPLTVSHAILQYFSETCISKKESSCLLDLECLSAILISKKVIKTNY